MLYEPDQFDRLIDEPWVRAHVEGAIATIVADVDAAFGLDRLWPVVNEWDEYRDGQPAKVLYTGAAGVSWAIETLRRGGHAETSLDVAAAALRALELERAEPDGAEDEHYRPGSLLHGETGPLLVAFLLSSDAQLADDLHELVHANVANPTDDISWGAPGTLLAALAMHEWTGAPGVLTGAWDYLDEDLVLAGAELIWQAGAHKDEKGHGLCHGTSGNGFALLKAFARTGDELWLERARRFAVHALAQADRIATACGQRRYSLFTGDLGTAFFAAACLDVDARFPVIDVM